MPIQGLKFNIPASTEQHQSFQATGSFTAYNPNDGYALVALDRTATALDFDHKLPSQSGGHFPGPINSYLSILYVDQSGGGLTGQVIVYPVPELIQVPRFWSIGRAVQSQSTQLDIVEGTAPPFPPAGICRIWADVNGNLFHTHSDGSDPELWDTRLTFGGVLTGSCPNPGLAAGAALANLQAVNPINFAPNNISAPNVIVQTGGFLQFAGSPGTVNLTWDGTNLHFTQGALVFPNVWPSIILPAPGGGLQESITWSDNGAGRTGIWLNNQGGLAANCVFVIDVANGSSGGRVEAIRFNGLAQTLLGGVLIHPAMSGGLTITEQWQDAGAGVTRIRGNTVGGAPDANTLQFDIANGTSGSQAVAVLSLNGSGRVLAAPQGDLFGGIGNHASNAVVGFIYVPSGGGAATGVPTYAGQGWIPMRFYPPANQLQAYLNGAWKAVTFT